MSDTFNVLSSNTHNEHPLLREDMEEVPTHQQTGIKEPKYSNANSIEGRWALGRLKLKVLVKDCRVKLFICSQLPTKGYKSATN